MKHFGGKAEIDGGAEVAAYVKSLQAQLDGKGGKKVTVKSGFSMWPLKGPNLFKAGEWVDAFSSVKSDGVIGYRTKNMNQDKGRDPNVPVGSPVPEKDPWYKKVSEGAKEWWHVNVENHDWSQSPWGSSDSSVIPGLAPLLAY